MSLCIPYTLSGKHCCTLLLWPFVKVCNLLVCHSYLFFYKSSASWDQCWEGLFAKDLGACSQTAFWPLPHMLAIRSRVTSGSDYNKVGFCCSKTEKKSLLVKWHNDFDCYICLIQSPYEMTCKLRIKCKILNKTSCKAVKINHAASFICFLVSSHSLRITCLPKGCVNLCWPEHWMVSQLLFWIASYFSIWLG